MIDRGTVGSKIRAPNHEGIPARYPISCLDLGIRFLPVGSH